MENKKEKYNFDSSKFWMGFALFLLGVIAGFFIAPIKKGMTVGCYNGYQKNKNVPNDYNDYEYDEDDDEKDCYSF